jgi:hypothetical protein
MAPKRRPVQRRPAVFILGVWVSRESQRLDRRQRRFYQEEKLHNVDTKRRLVQRRIAVFIFGVWVDAML